MTQISPVEQIIFYLWLFVQPVVSAMDALGGWLAALGITTPVIALGIVGAACFHNIDKWSIDVEERLHALELKLDIKRAGPSVQKKTPWLSLLVWFLIAIYLLGKSLESESMFAIGGIIIACLMFLIAAFCAYCFIDDAIRKNWGNKPESEDS